MKGGGIAIECMGGCPPLSHHGLRWIRLGWKWGRLNG